MKNFLRPGAFAALALALLLPAGLAPAQAVIKVNDDVNFKFGFLLQGQADWTENAATDSTAQNLFLRRVRLLVGGQVAKNVTFFFETDNPNLGKVAAGAKTISSGLIVQDAFVSWKLADEFTLDAGLILTGIAHNSLQSAASPDADRLRPALVPLQRRPSRTSSAATRASRPAATSRRRSSSTAPASGRGPATPRAGMRSATPPASSTTSSTPTPASSTRGRASGRRRSSRSAAATTSRRTTRRTRPTPTTTTRSARAPSARSSTTSTTTAAPS